MNLVLERRMDQAGCPNICETGINQGRYWTGLALLTVFQGL